MPDREKVIKGLEKLRKDLGYGLPDRSNVVMEYLNSITDAITLLKELEPHVIGLSEIEDGGGYWMTTMSSDFIPRHVICVHNEKDARKPYITLAWQYGTFSWEAETYGIAWCLWSAKPIGREW